MAIIRCPECGCEISDTCEVCIHCGFRLKYPEVSNSAVNFAITQAKSRYIGGIIMAPITFILSIIFFLLPLFDSSLKYLIPYNIVCGIILLCCGIICIIGAIYWHNKYKGFGG